jgi:hypothetical protein
MRKTLRHSNLAERSTGRTLLAFSLAASLAAFGCTTNRTPGNGEPVGVTPTGPAATTGSSSGNSTPSNPPMMSSSTHIEPLPAVSAKMTRRLPLSPDEAAAVMSDNLLGRGVRVLGPVNPGSSGRGYVSDSVVTGAYQDPIQRLGTGIVTVNSSVNSVAHLPALADGGGAIAGDAAVITGASTIAGTTSATGVTAGTTAAVTTGGVTAGTGLGSGGAVVFTPSATAVTPTTAALPFTAGAFAAGPSAVSGTVPGTTAATANTGSLTPTVSSSVVPTPTTATSAAITAARGGTALTSATNATTTTAATTANATTNAATTNATTGTARTARATTATTGRASGSAAVAPIRVSQDASGRVVVTNANGTTRTTASSAKQQR